MHVGVVTKKDNELIIYIRGGNKQDTKQEMINPQSSPLSFFGKKRNISHTCSLDTMVSEGVTNDEDFQVNDHGLEYLLLEQFDEDELQK